MQVHVPGRGRELPGEPWISVCGRNSLRARDPASIWLHGCVFERHMSGSDESDKEGQVIHQMSHLLICAVYLSSALWL